MPGLASPAAAILVFLDDQDAVPTPSKTNDVRWCLRRGPCLGGNAFGSRRSEAAVRGYLASATRPVWGCLSSPLVGGGLHRSFDHDGVTDGSTLFADRATARPDPGIGAATRRGPGRGQCAAGSSGRAAKGVRPEGAHRSGPFAGPGHPGPAEARAGTDQAGIHSEHQDRRDQR